MGGRFIHNKRNNVSVLLYQLVCPTKYRRAVIDQVKEEALVKALMIDTP